MSRFVLHPYAALLLLLCFGRTLLPEEWVLAWHPHQHTTAEPAHYRRAAAGNQRTALLTSRHQHCHAEQFYTVPFAPAGRLTVPQPRSAGHYERRAATPVSYYVGTTRQLVTLRGPPAASLAGAV